MGCRSRSFTMRLSMPTLNGVDPDFRIHVSDRLLELHDGPFLELGLKGIVGQVIQLPRRAKDRPDRERLAIRFEEFKRSA
jgi:putative restriction endonuclease